MVIRQCATMRGVRSLCIAAAALIGVIIIMITVLFAFTVSSHCIHDSPEMQHLIYDQLKIAPQFYTLTADDSDSRRQEASSSAAPIKPLRLFISAEDLFNNSRFCTRTGESKPNFLGADFDCSSPMDIFTQRKRDVLLNHLLPAAVERISRVLSVPRVASNLIMPPEACPYYTIPASHTTTGVPGADYVLYVSAGKTRDGVLAWAGACVLDDVNGRPIAGRANFGSQYLQWSDDDPHANEGQIDTATHEIIHALGFSYWFFKNNRRYNHPGTVNSTARGAPIVMVNTTNVVEKYRSYVNCSTVLGAELETEGSSGTAYSHWERRNLKDDIMTGAGGSMLSNLTLSALEDSGFYTVDYSKAESMTWGKNAGCDFLDNKCNTTAGGMGTWWCDNEPSVRTCDSIRSSIGVCGVKRHSEPLPPHFQYWPDPHLGGDAILMDYCGVFRGYTNRKCTEERSPTSSESVYGFFFGAASRCVSVNGLIRRGWQGDAGGKRCLRLRCFDGEQVQIKVGDSGWIECPEDGSAANVSAPLGFEGFIECPAAREVCLDPSLYVGSTVLMMTYKDGSVHHFLDL